MLTQIACQGLPVQVLPRVRPDQDGVCCATLHVMYIALALVKLRVVLDPSWSGTIMNLHYLEELSMTGHDQEEE